MSVVSLAVMDDMAGVMALETSFPASQRWSESSWRDELMGTNRHVVVSRDDVGTVEAVATLSLSGDVVDLHRIVTSPTARRRGLSRQLLGAGIDWARQMGASRILLEVEASNTPALSLYATAGFDRISERRDYYGPGGHAVILERVIPAVEEGEPS